MKVILYHANWCGHCKRFGPEWNKLKSMKNNNDELKDIEFVDYEYDKNKSDIDKANISGFPTIRVHFDNKVEEYSGERSAEAITDFIKNIKGYVKYKNKYIMNKLY